MKQSKKIETFRKIELLNLPEKTTGAYISVYASGPLNKTGSYADNFQSKYQIKIQDCSAPAILHGSLNNPTSRKNALAKIDSIVQVLTEFREHLTTQFKEHNVRF
ncbi:hypothetical protein V2590_07485 [Tenacibaculum maritimum]|uniref:hypothetical protein n=1 Tax=Tenacibaculum maritimum TaxID=107401 RepID=UPI003876E7A1